MHMILGESRVKTFGGIKKIIVLHMLNKDVVCLVVIYLK